MELIINDNKIFLKLGNFSFEGYKINKVSKLYKCCNQNAIVFSIDGIEDVNLYKKFYDFIKNLTISDFSDERIEFSIFECLRYIRVEPIDRLPFPFMSLLVGIKNGNFRIRLEALQGIDELDNTWNEMWITEFYFDKLSEVMGGVFGV